MDSYNADSDFTADCSRCFGLCCVALRFDRADGFGHDKAAGQACHFLQSDFRCRIHAQLDDLGYEGCGEFDCLGAGQRASAQFASLNWQRDPAIARQFQARFGELLKVQEMRVALEEASALDLTFPERDTLQQIAGRLAVNADRLGTGSDTDADLQLAAELIRGIGQRS